MKQWKVVSKELSWIIKKERTDKQCRERWKNYLEITPIQTNWTKQEKKVLFKAQSEYGNKWSIISNLLSGKSKNMIKNFYYSTIRRNLRRFNYGKPNNMKIHGSVDKLMKIPEIHKILTCSKDCSRKKLSSKALSNNTLELLNAKFLCDISQMSPEENFESDQDNAEINSYISFDSVPDFFPMCLDADDVYLNYGS